ncbi:MAG: VWA domain-containing protein [Acidobacteria bacterium]|nr:VWA domain-containing protein [Acidobacteriota bacterium]
MRHHHGIVVFGFVAAVLVAASGPLHGQDGFRFKSGVELVNVNITVTDRSGRFVEGLRQEDFLVYDDNEEQEVTHFSAERVPVSLGVALDTSGSMVGEKIESARAAIDRFLLELLGPEDEVFLMRFGASAELVHDWTNDKALLSRRLARINPAGGTAMYDAVAESVPLATQGQHRKKAILLISDGNDTNSHTSVREVKQMVRETEVLVYAVGIDGNAETSFGGGRSTPPVVRQPPVRTPFPFPGGSGRGSPWPGGGIPGGGGGRGGGRVYGAGNDDRVNAAALREITDDSGGRTEIVRTARDLDPATENIADELSKQYYLGYPAPGHKDGRWHTIRVEVNRPGYTVRARRGYTATK